MAGNLWVEPTAAYCSSWPRFMGRARHGPIFRNLYATSAQRQVGKIMMKNRQVGTAFLLGSFALLAGCANPYTRFYRSYVGDQPPQSMPNYLPCSDSLQIFTSDNFDRDAKALVRQGYVPVGFSDFISGGQGATEENIRSQAANVGACRVLIASKYQGTVSGAIPWVMPTTNTSYTTGSASAYGSGGSATAYGNATTTTYGSETVMIPYSQAQYESGALFLARRKYQFGAQFNPVPSEITQRVGKNGGLLIVTVVQGTPAYNADILEGDVIWSIDGMKLDMDNFNPILTSKLGNEMKIELYRGDKFLTKSLTIPRGN